MEGSNEIAIDVEDQPRNWSSLVTSMTQELQSLPGRSPSRCIYRVPKRLREERKKAYIPHVVSIGPLHHNDAHLKPMEEHKMRYVKDFLDRSEVSLESCIKKVGAHEERLRNCYAEHFKFTSDKFVRLALVDALFLIEFLLKRGKPSQCEKNDYICGTPWIEYDLWSDLVMLENQLPLFILEILGEHADGSRYPIRLNAYGFFWYQIYSHEINSQNLATLCDTGPTVHHFVDVIRNLCLPMEPESGGKRKSIRSITQLHQAGVKFKVRSAHNLLDIHYANGVLEIPTLRIQDSTETIIRNVIAYEQCHYLEQAYICQYVSLIDHLLDTREDVELLVKDEILTNMLGDSNQVSTLINNLGKGVITNSRNFYFVTICDGLNDYYKKAWHKWRANLKQKYLNTPWAAISVCAAILLLMLTITQTTISIISIV